MADLSGFNPFKPSWRFDKHRISYCFIHFIAIFMTVCSILSEWPDRREVVKVSMGIGIFVQSLVKPVLSIVGGKSFGRLSNDVAEMYKKNELRDEKRRNVLNESVKNCDMIFKILFFIDASAVLIFFIYPMVVLFAVNKQNPMLPFYFPYIDRKSSTSFIVNSTIHGVLLVYTLLFHNSFDSIFTLFVMQVATKVKLMKIDFDELQEYLERSKLILNEPETKLEIRRKLRSIIILQQELDSYIENLSEFFIKPCFVTSTTSIFSICIALVLMLMVKWVMSYGLVYALLGQLFVYFLYGTLVHHQIELLHNHIANFAWHLLDVAEQKSVAFMISKTQRPLSLEMMFIGRLTMETFTNVSIFDLNM